jgi:acetyl-CoA acyltransferase 1
MTEFSSTYLFSRISNLKLLESKPMGWTSENVAAGFDISRDKMDSLAALSQNRAEAAQKAGVFRDEIVPIQVITGEDENKIRRVVQISEDDGIRYGTTKESLSKVRSAFPQFGKGHTTGGNASQITDGGAAVLLMTRRKANELGLKWVFAPGLTSIRFFSS